MLSVHKCLVLIQSSQQDLAKFNIFMTGYLSWSPSYDTPVISEDMNIPQKEAASISTMKVEHYLLFPSPGSSDHLPYNFHILPDHIRTLLTSTLQMETAGFFSTG
jgi:hypothetical protein